MFTGLIEAVGEVADVTSTAVGYRLRLACPLANELSAGDSIAVNGVCLTAVAVEPNAVLADVSPETARVTTLGGLEPGRLVNLERPMRADGRVGGHFVQGHVDATGSVEVIRHAADFHWLAIEFPTALAVFMVPRGSVAVDGVSLTIVSLEAQRFGVQIVPYTWEHTNFHRFRDHEPVNLECDILGKYVARAVEVTTAGSP